MYYRRLLSHVLTPHCARQQAAEWWFNINKALIRLTLAFSVLVLTPDWYHLCAMLHSPCHIDTTGHWVVVTKWLSRVSDSLISICRYYPELIQIKHHFTLSRSALRIYLNSFRAGSEFILTSEIDLHTEDVKKIIMGLVKAHNCHIGIQMKRNKTFMMTSSWKKPLFSIVIYKYFRFKLEIYCDVYKKIVWMDMHSLHMVCTWFRNKISLSKSTLQSMWRTVWNIWYPYCQFNNAYHLWSKTF